MFPVSNQAMSLVNFREEAIRRPRETLSKLRAGGLLSKSQLADISPLGNLLRDVLVFVSVGKRFDLTCIRQWLLIVMLTRSP